MKISLRISARNHLERIEQNLSDRSYPVTIEYRQRLAAPEPRATMPSDDPIVMAAPGGSGLERVIPDSMAATVVRRATVLASATMSQNASP